MMVREEVEAVVRADLFIEAQVQTFEAVFGHEDIGTGTYVRLLNTYIYKLTSVKEAALHGQ